MAGVNDDLTLSTAGEHCIETEEACKLTVYRDQVRKFIQGAWGYPTIGIGHKLRPGDGYTLVSVITRERAIWQLHEDCKPVLAVIHHTVLVRLTQHQIDALTSFGINVGSGLIDKPDEGLDDSMLLKVINCQAGTPGEGLEPQTPEWFAVVRAQFMRWIHGGGEVLPVLVGRRKREATLFETPDEVLADLTDDEKREQLNKVWIGIDAEITDFMSKRDTDPSQLDPNTRPEGLRTIPPADRETQS